MTSVDLKTKKNGSAGTVLRIKRKRTADVYSTLLLHGFTKKSKPNEEEITDNNFVFHLAGTIENNSSKIHNSTKDVIKNYRKKGFHHEPDVQIVKEKNRTQCKVKQISRRFKILSRLRQDLEEINCVNETKNNVEDGDMQIYDIQQEVSLDDIPTAEDLLMCNSAKMIREKLNLFDESQPDEYVFDVYYAPDKVDVKDDQFLELEEYYEELVNELESDIEHDDSDDENAEGNWRNDYPDEDYYSSEENSEPDFGIPSSDDDDDDDGYVYQGYRQGKERLIFDPFGQPEPHEEFDHSISDPEEYP